MLSELKQILSEDAMAASSDIDFRNIISETDFMMNEVNYKKQYLHLSEEKDDIMSDPEINKGLDDAKNGTATLNKDIVDTEVKEDTDMFWDEETFQDMDETTPLESEDEFEDDFAKEYDSDFDADTHLDDDIDYKDDYTLTYDSDFEADTDLDDEIEYKDNRNTPIEVDQYSEDLFTWFEASEIDDEDEEDDNKKKASKKSDDEDEEEDEDPEEDDEDEEDDFEDDEKDSKDEDDDDEDDDSDEEECGPIKKEAFDWLFENDLYLFDEADNDLEKLLDGKNTESTVGEEEFSELGNYDDPSNPDKEDPDDIEDDL